MLSLGVCWEWTVRGRTHRKADASAQVELIVADVPCSRCACSLRGVAGNGQCPECGMDNRTSLAVAVNRCEDHDQLDRLRWGLDAQVWATLVALVGAVVGPLLLGGWISCDVFAFVVGALLSTVAAAVLAQSSRYGGHGPASVGTVTAMALGSAAMFIPPLLIRVAPAQHMQTALVALMLAGCAFWFVGECAKMHLIERCAMLVSGSEIVRRARHLRWGSYAVALLVAFAVVPLLSRGGAAYLNSQFAVMIGVSLVVFTLMGARLYGQTSQALAQQSRFAEAVRRSHRTVNWRFVPDEPNWSIAN